MAAMAATAQVQWERESRSRFGSSDVRRCADGRFKLGDVLAWMIVSTLPLRRDVTSTGCTRDLFTPMARTLAVEVIVRVRRFTAIAEN